MYACVVLKCFRKAKESNNDSDSDSDSDRDRNRNRDAERGTQTRADAKKKKKKKKAKTQEKEETTEATTTSQRIQTHRHTDTQTHRHTDTQTHRHTDTQTQTHRHTDTQTQTHRHTDTQTQTHRLPPPTHTIRLTSFTQRTHTNNTHAHTGRVSLCLSLCLPVSPSPALWCVTAEPLASCEESVCLAVGLCFVCFFLSALFFVVCFVVCVGSAASASGLECVERVV